MKKIFLLVIFALTLTAFGTSENAKQFDFIGKWAGNEKQDLSYIAFEKDSSAYLKIKDEVIGGKNFILNGKAGKMMYEIDYTSKPINIDLIITQVATRRVKRMFCIVEPINKNKIKFAIDFDKRPTDFKGNKAIVLTRVKD